MTRRAWLYLSPVALGALIWTFGSLVARANNRTMTPPAAPGRVIRLDADGVHIEASYWPGASPTGPAILLLHGIDTSRDMFANHAAWLNGLGYAVLAPDFRGHGASAAVARSFGWRETADARVAFAFLQGEGHDKIGVLGVSMGGAAALLGPAPLPADALILQAVYPTLRIAIGNRAAWRSGSRVFGRLSEPLLSYQSWPRYGISPGRIAPILGLANYRGPVLVIGGSADRDTTVADTRALAAAAPGPTETWIVDGTNHVETCDLWTSEYRERVGAFFAETLGGLGASHDAA